MTREELKAACTLEGIAAFLEPADIFDKGITGITADGFHVIYDYEKLITAFMDYGFSEAGAHEWLDYNTIP